VLQVAGYEQLRKTLEERLAEYNESNAVMNLVLFQQAMEHVCRIARIIDLPRGNAMLVGVGGSGKQSLARLASFICGYGVFQIAVSGTYGVADFKENLLQLYTKAGMKARAPHCHTRPALIVARAQDSAIGARPGLWLLADTMSACSEAEALHPPRSFA
jgi:P-loop containing dynein motor region D4